MWLLRATTASVAITIEPVNDPPVVAAGKNRSASTGETVVLDGGQSNDIDDDTLHYSWAFIEKPASSGSPISTPGQKSCSFVPDVAGVYTLRLTVTDAQGANGLDDVSITVSPRLVETPQLLSLSQAAAEERVAGSELWLGSVTTRYSDTTGAGLVLEQDPDGLTLVEPGTLVNLVISRGPEPKGPGVTFAVTPATVSPGQTATLTWTSTDATRISIDQEIGVVPLSGTVVVMPKNTTTYALTAIGPSGATSAKVTIPVLGSPHALPTESFGSRYEDLIPSDATVANYDPNRFALVTGMVKDEKGQPLSGVKVTIHDHPEYGTATSDEDGGFTLPVDGGGAPTLVYEKAGRLTAHRQVSVGWNSIATAEIVVLLPEDKAATTITFNDDPAAILSTVPRR